MLLPVLIRQSRELTADLARSALPSAPVRPGAAAPAAAHISPGRARRAVASVLRRSADRLAPLAK